MIDAVSRRLRRLRTEDHLPERLVARGSSKRLVNVEYMRLPEPLDSGVRTVGGADLIVLNESIVYERLNNLLY